MTAYVILFAMSIACGAVLWRCRARYRTPGGAAAQSRTHPASRTLVCVLCVELAMAGLMTRGAYADAYQVAWSTDSDGTQWCFVVSPDNEFDATLYALGLGMYPLSQDQRAYLSSAEYGGMFYTISQRWAPIQHYLSEYEGSSLYTQFLAFVMDTPLMQVTYNIMGMDAYTNVWTATISDAEKEQAKQDFNDVVNGNIGGGGGGSGGSTSGPLTFTLTKNDSVENYAYRWFWIGGSKVTYAQAPDTFTITFSAEFSDKIRNAATDNSNILISTDATNASQDSYYSRQINIRIYNANDVTLGKYQDQYYSLTNTNYPNSIPFTTIAQLVLEKTTWNISDLNSNNNFYNTTLSNQYVMINGSLNNSGVAYSGGYYYFGSISGTTVTPTPPENNWPQDEPLSGTPQVPEPTGPTVNLPNLPTVTIDPTINISVPDPTNTTPQDYTPWLEGIKKAIVDGFNQLYDSLASHCLHFQDRLVEVGGYVADTVSDNFEAYYQALSDYLEDLFNWLAARLNYTYTGYNDSSVIYWLKRIWMRLGGGSPSPVNEPGDAWDWFTKLIVGLLSDIIAAGSDLAADVAELISQVMTKFPFSIPWDIAAILGLFVATPLTPHFEVPVNVPNVVNTTLVIDLGFLDGAMTTVRAFELIAFAVYLLWMTKDIVKIFDETGFV